MGKKKKKYKKNKNGLVIRKKSCFQAFYFFSVCLIYRLIEWLQERFSETSPAPVQDSEPSELNELKAEMTKNTKRIKSMMTMLEAQSKLLRTLAKTIDPKFELLNDAGDISRVDNTDGVLEKSLEAGKGFGSFGSAITEPNI